MLNSCLNKDNNIFDEIKRQRRCDQVSAATIDGHTDDIPDYLATKYEELYNEVDDKENLLELEVGLEDEINDRSVRFIDQITAEVLKNSA